MRLGIIGSHFRSKQLFSSKVGNAIKDFSLTPINCYDYHLGSVGDAKRDRSAHSILDVTILRNARGGFHTQRGGLLGSSESFLGPLASGCRPEEVVLT